MRQVKFLLLACLLLISAGAAHAANTCPWINKATAFGVLGITEDSPMASVSELSPTVCGFTYRNGGTMRELRVTVEQSSDPHADFTKNKAACGSKALPMRAIGNEAVMCPAVKSAGENVYGRVRDQVFTITLAAGSFSKEELAQKANLVAEQVVGNLF